MKIKEVQPFTVFYHTQKTTLAQLTQLTQQVPEQVYTEADKLNLTITGPMYWVYDGIDGKFDTEFTLEIAVPVEVNTVNECPPNFGVKQLEPYTCASVIHKGAWGDMMYTYDNLVEEIEKAGRTLNGKSREVYMQVQGPSSPNNVTEIQLGIV